MNPMIELRRVSKSFGSVQAVRELSLEVPAGELFCFLGPNGAGKTTTIKMLCGLLRPDSGTVRVGGLDPWTDARQMHRIIGYIPDFPFLYDRLTVTEFFDFTGELYGLDRQEVRAARSDVFERFGLREQAHALIKDLSHGYRQRLIYAVTLLHQPRVFFVDEPFVGLDPFSIRLIKNLLREQAKAGATVFMTTHILALVEDLADRLGMIVGGSLVAVGSLAELARLTSPTTQGGRLEDIFFSLTSPGGADRAAPSWPRPLEAGEHAQAEPKP